MKTQADFGVIVVRPVECAAVLSMLDNYKTIMPTTDDPNIYYLGALKTKTERHEPGFYWIAVAQCPKMGNNGSAMVAKDIIRTFGVKHLIMVGIAGGIPSLNNPDRHVRLGDIVISYGKGVIQYDFTKRHPDGSIEIRSSLPPPSRVLIGAVDSLEAARLKGHRPWEKYIIQAGKLGRRPKSSSDKLYIVYGKKRPYWKRVPYPQNTRPTNQPKIHYSLIGSGNCLMKDIRERDRLANELGILAIEMEGAGIADATWDQTEVSDYLIIRGISDYADRNKNDEWQPYAAVVAAAYLKALLEMEPIPPRTEKIIDRIPHETLQRQQSHNEALSRYIKWVRNTTRDIVIRGAEKAVSFPLSTTFISLELSSSDRIIEAKPPSKMELDPIDFSSLWPKKPSDNGQEFTPDSGTIPAESVLSIESNVVILGLPGSGKTTILQYIAYMLSTGIHRKEGNVGENLGFMGKLPIPVFIPLNAFGNYLQSLSDTVDPTERTLLHFIEHYIILRQANLRLPLNFFSDILLSGQQVVLLLDGLDEIADEAQRVQISRAIQDLARAPYPLNFVVTSRTMAYHGEIILPPDFQEFHIRPLSPQLIRIMIEKLCAVIYDNDEAKRKQSMDELVNAVDALETRRRALGLGSSRLIKSALMVRILITLFLRYGQVADRRTELFRDYIDALLQLSYNPDAAVAYRLSESAGPLSIQRALLNCIAFELHMKSDHGEPFLHPDEMDGLITSYLIGTPENNEVHTIKERFLKMTRQRGGLIEFDGKELKFTHLAFQEFLTGQYIEENNSNPKNIVEFFESDRRIARNWWQEPLIHCIGLMHSKNEEKAKRFVELLAHIDDRTLPDKAIIFSELEAVGEACIEHRIETNLSNRIANVIQNHLFEKSSIGVLNARRRAKLGCILGVLGDTRLDVMCSIPTTVKIKEGAFLMGNPFDRKILDMPSLQSGIYEIYLDEYWIGKYPVTNSQFEEFISSGGYSEDGRKFWTDAGWEWKSAKGILSPAYWDYPELRIGNHPVVGVSWFEAVAYCNWLSELTGRKFRLSTEAEWEKATSGRGSWPWGSNFSPDMANTSESGIGQPTCVGLFIGSESIWGIQDAAGNVWEWCNSQFRTYGPYNPSDGREDINGVFPRCIRGGSWLNNKERARCANRDHYFPGDRHFDVGFRIVEVI